MKTAELYFTSRTRRPTLPFPNAASRRDLIRKAVDFMLIVASCVGIVAIMLFFVTFA